MDQDDASGGLRGLRATLSLELVKVVCASYGFSRVDNVVDLGGSSCLNLLIDDGSCHYVVRVYRPYVTKARLNDIQHVRCELAADGVPCSNILLSQDEQPWIVFNDRLVEVEHYVDHDMYMDSWEQLEIALPMLGHIHSTLRSVATSSEGKYPVFANYIEPQVVMDRTHRGTRRIRSWASSPAERHLADAAEELARLVTKFEDNFISVLPRQLVQGDFWHNNVFFRNNRVVLITDFDFMGERARIDDLALTLYFTSLKYAEHPVSDDQLRGLSRLVDAYDSGLADHLSSVERAALPLALARQPLWSIGGWVPLLDDEVTAQQHAIGTSWAVEWALEIIRQLGRWQTAFA